MWQFVLTGICKGSVYALMALGFGLIYSTTRVMHLAHAGVFVAAAYGLFAGVALLGLPLGVALVMGSVCAVLAGLLIEMSVYWPLAARRASATVLLISSLGVQIVIANLVTLLFGTSSQVAPGLAGSVLDLWGAKATTTQILQVVAASLATAGLALLLWKTTAGELIRALSDDPELAIVLGLPVRRLRLLVVGIGSLLAGAAGLLIFVDVGIEPHSGFPFMLAAAVSCIIGGLHHMLAPAAGAVLLGLLQSLVVWTIAGRWEEAVTFGLLVVFLISRPQGIFGIARRVDE